MIFQATSKIVIVFVKLTLSKIGVEGFIGPPQKGMSYKKIICKSYQRSKSENKDYCSHFSLTLETTSKCLIFFFVRLILGEKGFNRVTGLRWEIDIRYEFDLKVI